MVGDYVGRRRAEHRSPGTFCPREEDGPGGGGVAATGGTPPRLRDRPVAEAHAPTRFDGRGAAANILLPPREGTHRRGTGARVAWGCGTPHASPSRSPGILLPGRGGRTGGGLRDRPVAEAHAPNRFDGRGAAANILLPPRGHAPPWEGSPSGAGLRHSAREPAPHCGAERPRPRRASTSAGRMRVGPRAAGTA